MRLFLTGRKFCPKYKESEINLAVLDLLEYMKSGGTDYWESNQLEYILFNPSIDEIVGGKIKFILNMIYLIC